MGKVRDSAPWNGKGGESGAELGGCWGCGSGLNHRVRRRQPDPELLFDGVICIDKDSGMGVSGLSSRKLNVRALKEPSGPAECAKWTFGGLFLPGVRTREVEGARTSSEPHVAD